MVDIQRHRLEQQLRENVSRFLNETIVKHSPVAVFMERIKQHHWTCFLCGGTIRDLLLEKKSHIPRDLDIIVHDVEKKELIQEIGRYDCRENKFGGFSVRISDWKADVWTLDSTWAFRNNLVQHNGGFSDYTKTTFLNIEAVAVEMFTKKGQKRTIFSNGFFESLINRMLEINLEENPDAEVNIARSICMGLRYKFAFGPNLRQYIVEQSDRMDRDRLLAILRDHYRMTQCDKAYLVAVMDKIKQGVCFADDETELCETHRSLF